jgi:hypothetical protein
MVGKVELPAGWASSPLHATRANVPLRASRPTIARQALFIRIGLLPFFLLLNTARGSLAAKLRFAAPFSLMLTSLDFNDALQCARSRAWPTTKRMRKKRQENEAETCHQFVVIPAVS